MELLIPGLLLVGLMVYLSTRIKRTAAAAYASETIETDEFRIVKAEGFIMPVDENSRFEFAAYSREFGKDEADRHRQASLELTVDRGTTLAAVREDVVSDDFEITDERHLSDGTVIIVGTTSKDGIKFES